MQITKCQMSPIKEKGDIKAQVDNNNVLLTNGFTP